MLSQADHAIGDLRIRYLASAERPSAWGFTLLPASLADATATPREWLESDAIRGLPSPWNRTRAWDVDPLVHIRVAGTPLPAGFAHGRTLHGSPSAHALEVCAHTHEHASEGDRWRTVLASPSGLLCTHLLTADPIAGVVRIEVTAENISTKPITLDHLASFTLGGLSPFAPDDAAGRLRVHRFRSAWSAEGRRCSESLESLHLERSWTGHGIRSERFGVVGSLPVNGWFPFVALEDDVAGVTWAAQLATPGTWHLEIHRKGDQVSLTGGGPDRLSGEWRHTLRPGECVAAPPAFLTVVRGDLDDACDRLVAAQRRRATARPTAEESLPIVVNEWCTSWGHPTHASLVALARKLGDSGATYLVIDDGWAERPGDAFQQNGDWRLNRVAFPAGLKATADAIRAAGLVPGLWFEFEAVNAGSAAWDQTSHLLHRDGVPLQVGNRRFWDFRDPWVHAYLHERVLTRLRDDGFGYLKIDCNDSLGPGVDGPLSPGENLRSHLVGVQTFLKRLHAELPDLVIENCASGGHRLEPSMMALTAMSSFSDAHETNDIPLIAANLNPLVWSAQKQIWAVLRCTDSLVRLSYSLAATFLGRMCLSGDLTQLDDSQWGFVRHAMDTYRDVATVIRDGRFRCSRYTNESYQHPEGHQIVIVHDAAQARCLIIWHRFGAGPHQMATLIPADCRWSVERHLTWPPAEVSIAGNALHWATPESWTGGVIVVRNA